MFISLNEGEGQFMFFGRWIVARLIRKFINISLSHNKTSAYASLSGKIAFSAFSETQLFKVQNRSECKTKMSSAIVKMIKHSFT